MPTPKVITGEFRAYIHWGGRWRHVYLLSSFDQTTLLGDTVRMIEFSLSKKSVDTLCAEKSKFHKKKPVVQSGKKGVAA